MRCVNCGKGNADVYVRNVDGHETSLVLCPSCYGKLYGGEEETLSAGGQREERECPICGTTLSDFRKTGLLGCANCYVEFRSELLGIIRDAQGKLKHVGGAPSGEAEEKYDLVRTLVSRQEELRLRLKQAYEKGNGREIDRIEALLDEVNKKLYGGDGS